MPVMKSAALLAALAALCLPHAHAATHPITHEDLWLMKRVGAPVPSPDGRWLAFSVQEPAYDDKQKASDLWIAPTDGSTGARRLTNSRGGETDLTWDAQGRRLYFVSKRESDEVSRIYVLDLAQGGEARALTSPKIAARAPRLSPDGRHLAYTVDVPRDPKADKSKYNVRAYEGFPIRNWDHWLDLSSPRIHVLALTADSEPAGEPRDLLEGTRLVASPGYAGRGTSSDPNLDVAWSPDGASLVFVASVNRNEAAFAFTNEQLWRVSLQGGEPVALTSGRDSWSHPKFAPDGRTLYALRERYTGRPYNHNDLVAIGWPAPGEVRELSRPIDRSVEDFDPSPDGRRVYFTAEDRGHVQLYAAPTGSGAPVAVSALKEGGFASFAIPQRAKQTLLVGTWESAISPPEIVRYDESRKQLVPLTRFNAAAVAAVDWQPVREFWHQNDRGEQIQSFIVLPPGFDAKKQYPLLVLMHGGPHTMFRDQFVIRWNYHLLASPGYVLIATNYKGSTGFGEAFAQSIQGDPLKGPADDINGAADAAIREFAFIDGTRQCAGGASYGGHLSNWMQASTTRYRCLVSHAGLINLASQWGTSDVIYGREVNLGGPPWADLPIWREQSPITYAEKFRTPVLLTIGEKDYRVPLNNTLEYWAALQRMKVPSRLLVFPDENHWILTGENSRYFYGEVHAWLAKWLEDGKGDGG